MNTPAPNQFSFNSFWLDVEKRQLLHRNQPVVLTRKALDTLGVLVQNAGRVVSREELKRLVWGDAFVEEATIAQNIFTLRKTLGEHEAGQNWIETIAGVGYRFTGPVQPYSPELAAERIGGNASQRLEPVPRARTRWEWIVPAVAVTFGVIAAVWWRYAPRHPRIESLAVLPFANLTGDAQQEYLAEGISDALLTDIAQVSGLRVISGSSAARYGKSEPARKLAQDLRVDALVEGAVLKNGDQLAVDVRLVQAVDDHTLWTARFDLSPHDLLGVEYRMSQSLVRRLRLTGEQAAAPQFPAGTGNVEAYEGYLKGRYFWNKRTADAYVRAIVYFDHAIALDPQYAHAYAGLADTYALLGSLPNATIARREAMPRAREAALTALRLDESLAEAHTSLAFVKMHYEWDWPGSEREFKRALELNPNYPTAHQWYAIWLMAQGKAAAALEEERRAQQADPLSMIIKTDTVQLLIYAQRDDEAIQQALAALEIDPTFLLAHLYLGEGYVVKQNYPAAIAEFRKTLEIEKGNTWALGDVARTYALTGQIDKSEVILRDLLKVATKREDVTIEVARVYAALGEVDQVFAWLEKAYRNREGGLILANRAPEFETLHGDPRLADLERRLGLPSAGGE